MLSNYLSDTLLDELPKYLKYLTNDTDLLYELSYIIIEDICKMPFEIDQSDSFSLQLGNIAERIFNSLTRDELTNIMISECEKSFKLNNLLFIL